MTSPGGTVWRRDTHVENDYFAFNYVEFSRLLEGQTLLRMYVSWHVVGDDFATTEPLFAGIEYRVAEPGALTPPPNPLADRFGLDGEWAAAEMHAPALEPPMSTHPHRNVWPREGQRLWDIKANRRYDTEHLIPYFVYAVPIGSRAVVSARVYWSMLIRP